LLFIPCREVGANAQS